MRHTVPSTDPDYFILQLFSSQAARNGGIIRRASDDIERFAGRDRFLKEIERRGYRAVENAGQIVVFCNAEPITDIA